MKAAPPLGVDRTWYPLGTRGATVSLPVARNHTRPGCSPMTTRLAPLLPVVISLLVAACGGVDEDDSTATNSTGATSSVLGGQPGTGGASQTGGATAGVGDAPGSGGEAETGGSASGAGGSATGGAGSDTGGVPGAGGVAGSGGAVTGGTAGSPTGGAAAGTGGLATGGGEGIGGAESTGGSGATGGGVGTGGSDPVGPTCTVPEPGEFQPRPSIGGGGTRYDESDHFMIFGVDQAPIALNVLEAAHRCFVEDWCWRSPGLSVHEDDPIPYKFNVYAVPDLSAGGYMQYDASAGLSYIEVLDTLVDNPGVTVHEYGHALTLSEYGWVEQQNTGFWWETVANFVADSFLTSPFCAAAREAFGVASGSTIIELDTVIGNAQWTICMNQNYYQAWPFLAYLTSNPDDFPGLGRMVIPELFRNHLGNNETPLHVLERLTAPVSVQTILGRYWARMAYLDIGHPPAQAAFFAARDRLNFDNLTAVGVDTFQPLPQRQPRYGGANLIPLAVSSGGDVGIEITNLGNGLPESNFTATLSIRRSDGTVRYVDLPGGSGQVTIDSGEEATLVVVNTPDTLYLYDPQTVGPDPSSAPENTGLNYEVQIVGAAPAN